MNVKLLVGIVLFVMGLGLAVVGITGVGSSEPNETTTIAQNNQGTDAPAGLGNLAVPILAGLSLAAGGLLIGISFGNWRNPRTNLKPGDEAVNPEGYHKMKHV